jgi:serine/threonine protein kinase
VRGDIYQLGKTLYFLLTGRDPFLIETDLLPRGIENIIIKATKQNPEFRYASVAELADDIETYLQSLNPTNSPEYRFVISLKQCEDLAAEGAFDKKNVENLLNSLHECKNEEQIFLKHFDMIPTNLLKIVSNQFLDEFKPILDVYTSSVMSTVECRKIY